MGKRARDAKIVDRVGFCILAVLFFYVLGTPTITGSQVQDTGAAQPVSLHLGGLGTADVGLPSPTGIDKITVRTCYNNKKTGQYYRLSVAGYSQAQGEGTPQFTYDIPQAPNWIGGKGKGCQDATLNAPSTAGDIYKIVVTGVPVKGNPRFSADFQMFLKQKGSEVVTAAPVPQPSAPIPQEAPQTPPQQQPIQPPQLNLEFSQYALTQKYKEVDVNNVLAGDPPLVIQFFLKNNGNTVVQPEFEVMIDSNPPVRKKVPLELSPNGAQKFSENLVYPIYPQLTPGKHTIEFKIIGTDIDKKTDITVVAPVAQPPTGSATQTPSIKCDVMADEGNQCLVKETGQDGVCRRGLTTDAKPLPTIKCVLSTGNLDGCENIGYPCSQRGGSGICAFTNPSAKDYRLRCYLRTCNDPGSIAVEQPSKLMECVKQDQADFSTILKCSDSDKGNFPNVGGKVAYQAVSTDGRIVGNNPREPWYNADTCYKDAQGVSPATSSVGKIGKTLIMCKNCYLMEFYCLTDKNDINTKRTTLGAQVVPCGTCLRGQMGDYCG